MTPLICLNIHVDINPARALYDPGSNISLINFKYAKKLNKKIFPFDATKFTCKTMGGEPYFKGVSTAEIKIGSITKTILLFVIEKDDFEYDILLGLDSITSFRLCQDHNLRITQAAEDSNNRIDSEIPAVTPHFKNECLRESLDPVQSGKKITINWNECMPIEHFHAQTEHLNHDKRNKIHSLIDKYESVFAKNRYDIGTFTEQEAHIKLIENKVVARRPYKCSLEDEEEIKKQVNELLKVGLIEESCSPFASPVTMAYRKSEGEKNRMCVDFRHLNKLISSQTFPFPSFDDLILRTTDCSWFSALDINSAFWSIPIRSKDRYKTGFVTRDGHYQWKCLPFGLKIASPVYQRILSGIIRRNNLDKFCVNYIDDILIFSKNFNEHLEHIEKVLQAIQKEGFRIKFVKCSFATRQVKYLGHIIEKNQIKPMSDNVIAIQEFPVPQSKKNIRQFLGKVNFYHKYIKNSSKLLEPLHNLLRKNVEFLWTKDCQSAFDKIKSYLTSQPILAIFDRNKPIRIYTDASLEGIGAVLKQPQADGNEKPVAYFSKKLTEGQKKKRAVFLECLAIKEALKYWQYWLLGNKFIVFSDHKPLENLAVNVRPDEELGDMMNFLSQFDFNIVYNPGLNNGEADCLSRNPVLEANVETNKNIIQMVNLLQFSEIIEDQKHISMKKDDIKRNNVIFRSFRGKDKIVLSNEGFAKLVDRIHNELGHIGKNSIIKTIAHLYHADNMYKIITDFTSACEICIKNKTRRGRNLGLLGHLGPATKPFEIMSLDTIGGFGGRRSSKRYLHLLVDHFTRFAYVSTSKTQRTEDFIKLIESVHSKNKIGTLLTDQYGGLTSQDLEDYLISNNIDRIFTAVDAPFSQGLNERLNQTLVNRIRCRNNEKNENRAWSSIARQCTGEYNNTVHSVTGFTPIYLLDGTVTPIVPKELRKESNLQDDRRIALDRTIKNHNLNKTRYDKNRKPHNFKVGDFVYVENGNKLNRDKLDEIRIGPFPVLHKLSDSVYMIKCGSTNKEKRLFHISKMVPIPNNLRSQI